jgi:hypothetical protein
MPVLALNLGLQMLYAPWHYCTVRYSELVHFKISSPDRPFRGTSTQSTFNNVKIREILSSTFELLYIEVRLGKTILHGIKPSYQVRSGNLSFFWVAAVEVTLHVSACTAMNLSCPCRLGRTALAGAVLSMYTLALPLLNQACV